MTSPKRRWATIPPGHLGLYTDLYELRMAQTYLRHEMDAPATFSLYARGMPRRPWLLALGIDAAIEVLDAFTYGEEELAYLQEVGFGEDFLSWLRDVRPHGELWAVEDGTVVIANEPILEFTAPLPFAQLVETAVTNAVQYPTLVATKAARCVLAADGPVIEFGLRRSHGLDTGVAAAVAAYVGGCEGTSNVEAGRRHGIPVVGTMAHSFVQAFEDEREAFTAFADDHPEATTLLVDTYDTLDGVRNAIAVADVLREHGRPLHGVRLDSGKLDELSRATRRLLDSAGYADTQIIASGGLDETAIYDLVLAEAPIDVFAVGTALNVSRDQPAIDIVYKLVEYDGRPRAKFSVDKASLPGRKQVFRAGGVWSDVIGLRDEELEGERLLRPVWTDGRRSVEPDIEVARARARQQLEELPRPWRTPAGPQTLPTPQLSAALQEQMRQLRIRYGLNT